jgi:hypothetical protein
MLVAGKPRPARAWARRIAGIKRSVLEQSKHVSDAASGKVDLPPITFLNVPSALASGHDGVTCLCRRYHGTGGGGSGGGLRACGG